MPDPTPEEPTFFSYRPLPAKPENAPAVWREMCDKMREAGATWFRMTIVSEDYPNEPYPHGLYMEGWATRPAKEAEFNYPLTTA